MEDDLIDLILDRLLATFSCKSIDPILSTESMTEASSMNLLPESMIEASTIDSRDRVVKDET